MGNAKNNDQLRRWQGIYADMDKRLKAQKESIDRLVQMNAHLMAGLLQITMDQNVGDADHCKRLASAALAAADKVQRQSGESVKLVE